MSNEGNNKAEIESNPIGNELQFELSIPEKIEIKMVDASSLNDYELWVFIASLLCNFLVGFIVAYISNTIPEREFLYITISVIFGLLFAFSIFEVYQNARKCLLKRKLSKWEHPKEIRFDLEFST